MKIIRSIAIISILVMISQSVAFAQGITEMTYIRGSLAGIQTIPSATPTRMAFIALQEEGSGSFSSGVFTPGHNGYYLFNSAILWQGATSINYIWQWYLTVYVSDGRAYQLHRTGGYVGGSGTHYPQNAGSISLWLTTDLTVEFQAYQNTGSNRNIRSSALETWFTITEVPMIALSQTATPQLTATPNATIPALATAIAALQTPEATATMEPITETIDISLAITNTTGISISRIPVSNTLHTTGYIYLPGWVLNFDPIAVMASLMIFIIVGAVMKKPTLFVISWFGLSILGVFSQSGIYWIFITIVMVAAVVIYLFFRHTEES